MFQTKVMPKGENVVKCILVAGKTTDKASDKYIYMQKAHFF